ncbi:hypothetical protein ACM9W9_18515 [Xanthomonas sacchari]
MSVVSAPERSVVPEECRRLGPARVQQLLESSSPPPWREEAERWLEEQALRSARLTQWMVLAGIGLSLLGIVLVIAFFW